MVKMESQHSFSEQVSEAAATTVVELPNEVTQSCKERNEFFNNDNSNEQHNDKQQTDNKLSMATCKLLSNQEQQHRCNNNNCNSRVIKNHQQQQISPITKSNTNYGTQSTINCANGRRNSSLISESTSILPPLTEGQTMENICQQQQTAGNDCSAGISSVADYLISSQNQNHALINSSGSLVRPASRPTLRDLKRFSSQEDNNNNYNGTTNSCSSTTSLDKSISSPIAIVQSSSSSSSSYYNYKRRNSSISQCSSNLSETTRAQLNFDLSPDLLPDSTLGEANSLYPVTTRTSNNNNTNDDEFFLDDERPPSPEPSSPFNYQDNSSFDEHPFKLEVDLKPTGEQQLTSNGVQDLITKSTKA